MTKQEWFTNENNIVELSRIVRTRIFADAVATLNNVVTPDSAPTFVVTPSVSTLEYNALKSAEIAGARKILASIFELASAPKKASNKPKKQPWEYEAGNGTEDL